MNETMTSQLYHCTSKKGLRSILASRHFIPSFCLEQYDYLDEDSWNWAFPMVCFADFSNDLEVKNHMEQFNSDSYLVMSKDWALKKGLSPVLYYNKSTHLSEALRIIHENAYKLYKEDRNNNEKRNLFNALFKVIAHSKKYSGKYYIKKDRKWSENETQFYNEHEWRYVPTVKEEGYELMFEDEFLDHTRWINKQSFFNFKYSLFFNWDDIIEIGCQPDEYDEIMKITSISFKIVLRQVQKKIKAISI